MKKTNRVKFPIVIKLISLISLVMVVTTVIIGMRNAEKFEESAIRREEASNTAKVRARATDVDNLFLNYVGKIRIVGSLLQDKKMSASNRRNAIDLSFRKDRDLIAVEVISKVPFPKPIRVVNSDYLKQYQFKKSFISTLRTFQKRKNRFSFAAVFGGNLEIRNSSHKGFPPLISIGVPLVKDKYGDVITIAVGEIRLDQLQKTFQKTDEKNIFLVDRDGGLLAGDETLVFKGASMTSHPLVKDGIESVARIKQKNSYLSLNGDRYTGAYARTIMGLVVAGEVSRELIEQEAQQLRLSTFYLAGRILSIALFFIIMFAASISAPLSHLVKVTEEISKGNFSIKSRVRSWDEVGNLGKAIDSMVIGLQERDRVKNVLDKFHGSSVAEDMIQGELSLGGSRKNVTVFFSDIRGFTKFSESRSAEDVVEMLNEYFHVMVKIVNRNNGVVDKFIGDAIMAVWGAPKEGGNDAQDALKACLQMREALQKLNEKRIKRNEVPIMIGMGIHSGTVISGTIGSDERMEYTVIGDSVNQASRIEASTKAFGTDLLISEETKAIVESEFVIEEAGSVEVKGKSEPLRLFKVRGYKIDGREKLIKTDYSDYEPGDVDKVNIAS